MSPRAEIRSIFAARQSLALHQVILAELKYQKSLQTELINAMYKFYYKSPRRGRHLVASGVSPWGLWCKFSSPRRAAVQAYNERKVILCRHPAEAALYVNAVSTGLRPRLPNNAALRGLRLE